jgi:hypothetical protein
MSEFSSVREFNINVEDLNIDLSLVENIFENGSLHNTGNEESLTSEIFNSIKTKIVLHAGYITVNRPVFDKKPFAVYLNDTLFVLGNSVYQQIHRSSQIILFFCSAGNRPVDLFQRLMDGGDWIRAYILDSLGTLILESAMDKIQEQMRSNASKHRWKLTNRFSPGYCSWDSSERGKFFSLMPKGFCKIKWDGAATLDSVKSVIGIIGAGKDVEYIPYDCNHCTSLNCLARKNEPLKNLKIRS